jgi:hypothetical protein
VGNLHLRFDEGRVCRATGVAFSPTLLACAALPFGDVCRLQSGVTLLWAIFALGGRSARVVFIAFC